MTYLGRYQGKYLDKEMSERKMRLREIESWYCLARPTVTVTGPGGNKFDNTRNCVSLSYCGFFKERIH